jgi:SH3-like domain-containing protein
VYRVKSLRIAGLACAFSTIFMGYTGLSATTASATEALAAVVGPSGLPLPRFVSLKSGRVNLRIGPGRDYPVQWLYLKPGLPVEIVQEYDNWRRIRDSDGTALTAQWGANESGMVGLYGNKDDNAAKVADMEPGVMGKIADCDGVWCTFESAGYDGYVKQSEIWGAYPGETFEN